MRTVPFISVLNGVARNLGMDPARDLNPARAATLTEYIQDRCTEGWKFDFWPEWTPCEQRVYRPSYAAGTAYAAPTLTAASEVWFPGSLQYYQALTATTGHAPATFANSTWTTNAAYWALCQQSYSANDWVAGTAYAVGAQARNPDDNRIYQCFTAHTSGGSLDLTKFGVLTPFDRYINYDQAGQTPMGEVKSVSRRSPRTNPNNPGYLDFAVSNDGVQVGATAPGIVFVQFRLRPPQFTASYWSATTTYAAGALALSRTTGESYVAATGTTNQDPASNPTVWTRQTLPEALASWTKRAATSDALKDQKQTDRAVEELTAAQEELADARDRVFDAQGQYETATVSLAGSPRRGWGTRSYCS